MVFSLPGSPTGCLMSSTLGSAGLLSCESFSCKWGFGSDKLLSVLEPVLPPEHPLTQRQQTARAARTARLLKIGFMFRFTLQLGVTEKLSM